MKKIDQLMVEKYHIQLIQMMEQAGTNLARLAKDRFFNRSVFDKKIIILAGKGNNGGGGLVGARILSNWGAHVSIALIGSIDNYKKIPKHQLMIVQAMGLEIFEFDEKKIKTDYYDMLIDAITGYGLKSPPYGIAKKMITWANTLSCPILALDIPSGMSSEGELFIPVIETSATMTLALPKNCFRHENTKKFVNELYLADISVPSALYEEVKINLPMKNIFLTDSIIRLY